MPGYRWGPEGPPEEAYSRVTNRERYRPLHTAATELLNRLEREFAVDRLEGHEADSDWSGVTLARSPIRLVPHDPQCAPIIVAFTDFPGIFLKVGSRPKELFPNCGCDACDEMPDELIEKMIEMVETVVSGGFRESMRVPWLLGDGSHESEFQFTGGGFSRRERRVRRSSALKVTGGKRHVTLDWKPWPPRRTSATSAD